MPHSRAHTHDATSNPPSFQLPPILAMFVVCNYRILRFGVFAAAFLPFDAFIVRISL